MNNHKPFLSFLVPKKHTKLGGSGGVGRAGDCFGGGAVKRCVNTLVIMRGST